MRTLIIILAGFLLWAVCLEIAKIFASSSASSTTIATASFIPIGFVAAAANMWRGISQAG
jgi:hypothetical protein